MRLVSCNIWGGTLFDPLMKYVESENHKTDIFCFQEVFYSPNGEHFAKEEVRSNVLNELTMLLHDYYVWFAPKIDNDSLFLTGDYRVQFGNAVFISHDLIIEEYGVTMTHGNPRTGKTWSANTQNRNAQHVTITDPASKKQFSIINTHGYWVAGDKIDTPESLEQSKRLLALTDRLDMPTILCGDFNLLPETNSIQMLSGPYKNLISEYKITNTRTSHYKKTAQAYADYTFVKDVTVKGFSVPAEPEISDHRLMALDFTL